MNTHMARRALRATIHIIAVIVSISSCVRRGDLIDEWQTSSGAMKVRVRKFSERGALFMPHTYFSLEAADATNAWKQVMEWKVDDAIAIQRQQVHLLSENVGYAFGNDTYVVTADGGRAWA